MEVSHWCDQHNLPRPVGDRIPPETLIYLFVSVTRGLGDLPAFVWAYLPFISNGEVAEA